MLAVGEFLAGLYYGVAYLIGYKAQFVVSLDGGHLHDAESLDELRVVAEMVVADIEILNTSQGLDAEESLLGNFFVAEQIVLCACLAGYGEFKLYHF